MFDFADMMLITLVFLVAGAVKGVIGLGLPTVSLALLSITLDLTTAMALMLAPSFFTNLWQAAGPGGAIRIFFQLWPFYLLATAFILLGAGVLTVLDSGALISLLGVVLVCYAVLQLAGVSFRIKPAHMTVSGALMGALNGLLTGMTGSFVVPGVPYLQAAIKDRDEFIQAMGILFTLSTVGLGLALGRQELLDSRTGLVSVLALVPAAAGMLAGQAIRGRLPVALFRRVFFVSLLVLGAYMILRNIP